MKKSLAVLSCAFGALLLAGPALAAERAPLPPQVRNDLQCFIIYSSVLGNSKDESVKQAAQINWTYYLGKIDGGANGMAMFEEVKAEAARMRTVDLQKIATACDANMSKRGNQVMAIGKALTAAGL